MRPSQRRQTIEHAQNTLKLCDFRAAAYITESYIPTAFSVRSASPYRLQKGVSPPLILEEYEYTLGVAVWELFTEKEHFAEVEMRKV